MFMKLAYIRNPPNMVADAIGFGIDEIHPVTGTFLAEGYGLQNGRIGMSAASGIVDCALARIFIEIPKHVHKVIAVNVVPDLLTFVTENCVLLTDYGALHQIGKKAM